MASVADVTTSSCRFVVTGEAITEIVRDLVREGRYSAVMRVLEDWAAYHFLNLSELPGYQCT